MIADEIQVLNKILMQDENILFALLFGSYAKNQQRLKSDIDIALYFKNPPEGLDLLDFMTMLGNYARKEVDVVVLNRASAFLRHQVMKHAVSLFIRDELAYRQFREKTMTDYDIYKYLSGISRYD